MSDEHRHWLVKSEPSVFSWDDLWRAARRTTMWDGVRNFQARNILRDQMRRGDRVFFYHSNADPTAIMGVCEVVREGYPDPTAFEPTDAHYDPKSDRAHPTWFVVDLRAIEAFRRPVTLAELRGVRGLEHMTLLKKGSRLSVQPVTAREWEIISALGTREPG